LRVADRCGYMPAMDQVTCLCTNLRRAALRLTSRYDQALAPHRLTVTQYSLLAAVERHRAPNLTELAVATGLDRSTLGRNVKGLEALALVRPTPTDDGRDRVVSLTRSGGARLRAARASWRRLQATLEAELGEDAARLVALTRRVAAWPGAGSDSEGRA
jgi:DNA-binding MarR family transcriptional regulator